MGTIISVANNKGGVSKTTTVLNLSSALARKDKKILMIDLDPQASLTIYAGLEPLRLSNTIYDVITEKNSVRKTILKTNDEKVHILPSSIDLSAAEVEIISKIGREFILKNILEGIKNYYDYIIIDNSPSLGILTINSLIASDYIIAPTEPTYLALRGLEILTSTVSEVQRLNTNLKLMGVLITLFDSRTTHHNEVIELLKKDYPTFNTVIKRSIKFSDACLASKSIIEYAGENFDGSKAYIDLAKEVLNYE